MQIQKLSQDLINKIAAGEVVERPASVVKELIENSIDAGATQIQIKIKNAGISEIQIIDNGSGIPEGEISLAFQEHSTSKIKSLDDLFNIHSNGFRGEALASISSVSQITIETKTKDSELATKCEIKNSEIISKSYSNREIGTSITVSELFYNVPARRKFLKSIKTEENKVIEAFEHIAFVYPEIAFSLEIDGKVIYALAPNPFTPRDVESFSEEAIRINYFNRASEIFKLDKINYIVKNFENDKFKINFILSKPVACVNRGPIQLLAVNNRFVIDQTINNAVRSSYLGFIPKELKIQYIIHLQIKPNLVDVNVHPRKLEVRWEDQKEIFSTIYNSIRQILVQELKLDTLGKLEIEGERNFPNLINENYSTNSNYSNNKSNRYPNTGFQRLDYKQNTKFNFQNDLTKLRELKSEELHSNFSISESEKLQLFDENKHIDLTYVSAFQVLRTYLILEYSDKVLIIDQHAAAERITYDKLKQKFEGRSFEVQQLLLPFKLELNQKEKNILEENLEFFSKLGIQIEKLNQDFVIQELPTFLSSKDLQKLVSESIADLQEYKNSKLEEIYDRLFATIACHSSYRGGDKMSRSDIDFLISELFKTEKPYSCPHGRPVIWELTKYELEKKFGRVG